MVTSEVRLWGCGCLRHPAVWIQLSEQGKKAVQVAEAYAAGKATDQELSAAGKAAYESWEQEYSEWNMANAKKAAFHITGPLLSDISAAAHAAAYAAVDEVDDPNAVNIISLHQIATLLPIAPDLAREWFPPHLPTIAAVPCLKCGARVGQQCREVPYTPHAERRALDGRA